MTSAPSQQRAVAYVRVSKERDGMISPELQLNSIQGHTERMGYTIVQTLEDLDLSGRFWKRRQMEQAVGMIERREADVIVVWKVSRVARNRKDWAIAVDRVEGAGGRLESATEPMDTNTSSGRFARGMLAELAAFESERIGETWKETHARRVRQGRPANGKPRFGYTYSRAEGFVPDPVTGDTLRQTYLRYIAGSSFPALAKWLNDGAARPSEGYTTVKEGQERLWGTGTIKSVLDSGFGAGYFTHRGEKHTGIHQAVITEAEWAEYLTRREQRAVKWPTGTAKYLLTGLIRCHCGSAMHGGQFGNGKIRGYRCAAVGSKGAHKGGVIQENVVERGLMGWISGLSEAIDASTTAKIGSKTPKPASEGAKTRLLKANRQDTARLDTLTLRMLDGTVDTSTYERLKTQLEDAIAVRDTKLRAITSAERNPVTLIVPDLLSAWPTLPLEIRRDLLSRLVERIEVLPRDSVPRTVIVPLWKAQEV
jgi:DNA invertase Pin-like site-specific DNA recombinase